MWVLGLVIMVDQIDQNVVRGVVDQLKHDFGISDAGIGLLLSAFVLVNGLVTVPAGYLADRWNRTRTIGNTVLGWSIITMLTAAATNFATLLGLRALLGFGQAITEPSAASLLSDYYPTEQRGRVFSNQQVMVFIGFGLGIALGGAVGDAFGWRAAFLVVGPPSILVAFLAFALREPPRGLGDRLHVGGDAVGATDPSEERAALFDHGFRQFVADMMRACATTSPPSGRSRRCATRSSVSAR
jgi:MFS family permease